MLLLLGHAYENTSLFYFTCLAVLHLSCKSLLVSTTTWAVPGDAGVEEIVRALEGAEFCFDAI